MFTEYALSETDCTVVFNEIMYHPATTGPGEWIELYNRMAVDVDLSGWTVEGGVHYEFPQGTVLRGGSYLVLAAAPDELQASTGLDRLFGPFAGRLSNAGETLKLVSHNRRVMDRVDYADSGDWPVAPDGSGVSLTKIDPDFGSTDPSCWGFSERVGGTPGRAKVSYQLRESLSVRFHEVSSCEGIAFRMEILNTGSSPVDVSGLTLSATDPMDALYVFDEEILEPGAHRVLNEASLSFRPGCGSRLFLFDPSGEFLMDACPTAGSV